MRRARAPRLFLFVMDGHDRRAGQSNRGINSNRGGICNLQNLRDLVGFESHPLRQSPVSLPFASELNGEVYGGARKAGAAAAGVNLSPSAYRGKLPTWPSIALKPIAMLRGWKRQHISSNLLTALFGWSLMCRDREMARGSQTGRSPNRGSSGLRHLPAGGTLSFARFRSKCARSSLSPGSMNVQSSVWWSEAMGV